MTDCDLKQKLAADMKDAMRTKDKPRLGVIRLAQAAIKQIEVDERVELDDTRVLAVLDKMMKQRRDSFSQFEAAGRQDLADQESFEMKVLQSYMPTALDETELQAIIADAIKSTGAESMKDMGKVMGIIKPKVQGRADMSVVSQQIKSALSG